MLWERLAAPGVRARPGPAWPAGKASLEVARSLGATAVVDAGLGSEHVRQQVRDLTEGRLADVTPGPFYAGPWQSEPPPACVLVPSGFLFGAVGATFTGVNPQFFWGHEHKEEA